MIQNEASDAIHRILVVDDHRDTVEALSFLLTILGYQTRGESRGRDALRAAHEFDPQLILLDVGLPDLSGYEVVHAMRADPYLRDRFIVAVTGYGQPQDVERAYRAGFDQHFLKPVGLPRLRDLMRLANRASVTRAPIAPDAPGKPEASTSARPSEEPGASERSSQRIRTGRSPALSIHPLTPA